MKILYEFEIKFGCLNCNKNVSTRDFDLDEGYISSCSCCSEPTQVEVQCPECSKWFKLSPF